MDFRYDEPVTAFAGEVRAFLAEQLTEASRRQMHDSGTVHDAALHRLIADRGWLTATTAGGVTGDPFELAALFRELELADAPYHGLSTSMIVMGVIERLGSPALKASVLPTLAAGESIAVLGYSEPGSGSDVAAARTRAVPVDEQHSAWLISGQKMWTTLAHEAGYVLLLTRTDAAGPRHRGLTMFVVPLDTPGITIQPIHTISDERTNVVFYDEVRVFDDYRVGEVNEGWQVMAYALSLERGVMGGTAALEALLHRVERWAREIPPGSSSPVGDPDFQEAIARARIDAEVANLLTQRTAWLGAGGESPALAGNMAKLFASTSHQRAARELQEAVGASGILTRDAEGAVPAAAAGDIERAVRHAAVTTIQGGTTEVQRNHIAEHGLGLPKTRGVAPAAKPAAGPGDA
jgi:alkylation response protein AidB-like acyl-CoA dehydrogenase